MVALVLPLTQNPDQLHLLNAKNDFEHEMVRGLKCGDQKALENLYKMYSGSLYGIISRIVKFDEVAEDILQDTFIKIWKSIDHYEASKGRLFTWMARLAKNSAIDHLRSKSQVNSSKNDSLGDLSIVVDRSHHTQYNPEIIGVKKLTEYLTPAQKEILELVYFQGYTQAEVADELSIPIGTVKTRIRLAILTLRTFF